MASDSQVDIAVKEYCRIPARCPGHQQSIVKSTPLWDLRLSPDVDSGEEEGADGSRRAFSMKNLQTNQPYDLTLVPCSDPKTQYALLHILEAKGSTTSLDNWSHEGKEALLQVWEVSHDETRTALQEEGPLAKGRPHRKRPPQGVRPVR
jgi:hypothetical protein